MIQEIDQICSDNHISYYLGGGTALGAVRHQGFLPWDDDADLYITHDNWIKLLSVIDTCIPEGRALVCNERYERYCNPIARYMDLNTTWIYQSQMFAGTPLGQHVEFLILDPLPANQENYQGYLELYAIWNEILSPYFVINRKTDTPSNVFNESLYDQYLDRVEKEGRDAVLRSLENQLFTFPDDDSCTDYHLRHGVEIHIYSKKNFGEQRYIPYENTKLPVAQYAENVFRQAYGDSWKIVPDEEHQVTHNSVHNLEVPYTEYTKRYLDKVDSTDAWTCNKVYKQAAAKRLTLKDKVRADAMETTAILDHALATYLYSDNRVYDSTELDDFYALQTNGKIFEHRQPLQVSISVVKQACHHFLHKGEYWKVLKLAEIYKTTPAIMDSLREEIGIAVESREIDIFLDNNDSMSAVHIAQSAHEKSHLLSPLYLQAIIQQALDDTQDAYSQNAFALSHFPHYPFFQYVDALLSEADHKSALAKYQSIINTSRNGIIVLKATNRLRAIEEQ